MNVGNRNLESGKRTNQAAGIVVRFFIGQDRRHEELPMLGKICFNLNHGKFVSTVSPLKPTDWSDLKFHLYPWWLNILNLHEYDLSNS
jgi:hypothetical protein